MQWIDFFRKVVQRLRGEPSVQRAGLARMYNLTQIYWLALEKHGGTRAVEVGLELCFAPSRLDCIGKCFNYVEIWELWTSGNSRDIGDT